MEVSMPILIRGLVAGVTMAWLVVAMPLAGTQKSLDAARAAALHAFIERIGEYAALHQRFEAPLPPLKSMRSQRSAVLNQIYLASAIKAARPNAREGDIFTAPVASLFRSLIANALEDRQAQAQVRDLLGDHPRVTGFHPQVHDIFPYWADHPTPLSLVQALPKLPEEVEYRLVGRDLVLWDVHADLIVDVLRDAVPLPSSSAAPRRFRTAPAE
jgi:hypothetical protein